MGFGIFGVDLQHPEIAGGGFVVIILKGKRHAQIGEHNRMVRGSAERNPINVYCLDYATQIEQGVPKIMVGAHKPGVTVYRLPEGGYRLFCASKF